MPTPDINEYVRRVVAHQLEAEVMERDQYYGLDNWPFREVVDFVCDRVEKHSPRQPCES